MAEKKKTKEQEKLRNPAVFNRAVKDYLKESAEKIEKENKVIEKKFGNDSGSSPHKGNIESSPARRKSEPIVFDTKEDVDTYVNSLAKQTHKDLKNPTNFNNAVKTNAMLFNRKNNIPSSENSPYHNMDYRTMTDDIHNTYGGELRRGNIDQNTYYKERAKYDTERILKANKEELKELLEEKSSEREYLMFQVQFTGTEEQRQNSLSAKNRLQELDVLLAEINSRIADIELEEKYDNTLLDFGRIAVKSGASDEYSMSENNIYVGKGLPAPDTTSPRTDTADFINYYKAGKLNENEIKTASGEISNLTFLTDSEVKLYNTLHNNNPKDAERFLKEIEGTLNKRLAEYQREKALEYGQKHPYLAGLKSVAENVTMGLPAAVDNVVEGVTGNVDTYDATSRILRESQALRQGGSDYFNQKYGKTGGFLYNTGLSIVENLANVFLFKGAGKVASGLVAVNMAGNAATTGMIDVADRGGSDFQIIASGIANGAAEYLFEKFSVEKLFNIKGARNVGDFVKTTLAQSGIEASEEIFTETANILTDAIIMQEKSENATKLREYIMQGMSYEEASKKVFHESITEIALAGASGLVSGGVMGGGATLLNNANRTNYMTTVGGDMITKTPQVFQDIVKLGIENNNTDAIRAAENMFDGNIDAKTAGKVISSVIEQNIEQNGGIMNIMQLIGKIEGRGSSYIGSMESINTAKSVMHMVQGKITDAERAIISRSDGAVTLLTAIEGNEKAWNSVKEAAGRELRSAPQMQNNEDVRTWTDNTNNATVSDGEIYSDGKKLSIPEKVRQANNIILDENSSEFRNKDAKGYKVVETLAKDLKKKVKFVKGLADADGNQLDGAITEDGIYINTEGENPVRWAATHEFSHAMKQSATESWSRYQNYVVSQMKRNGSYESVFVAKAKAYGTADANYINEEIAADYIGDLFSDVDSLADFIRESRRDAVTIRDMWYSILDKLGLLSEKKKAQLMWRDAYREAVLNVKDGKVESKSAEKKSASGTRTSETNGDDKITVDMDERKRAEILKKASLNVVEAKSNALKLTLEEISILESKCKSKAQGVMEELCEKFGVIKEGYTNNNIELEFNYSKGSLRESVHKQNERNPDFQDFAKMLTVFDSVIENAVPIESHTDKYKGTKKENPNLKQSYVLLSAFKSGEDIVPVELNIKEFKEGTKNKLYMSVTLKKIRADILAALPNNSSENATPSTLNISIAELIKNVNPSDGDFLRYAPDEMLNEAQIESKNKALEKDKQKIEGLKKSISGTRLSEIDNSPAGESVDTTTEENSQKFIKPGAEPRREVKVPESVKEGTKVRQFARTAAEAETLSDETSEGVLQDVEDGKFNYTPISDKSAMSNAYASLDAMGVEWVEKKVSGAIASHSLDKKTVALAEVLMQRYSEEGQHEKVQKLIVDFAAESTRTAQSLQAISMLKKLDPNYEVSYIDKVVENLREDIIEKNNKKKFGKKHSADIEVSEELKTKLMEAKTEEEREAVRDEIYTEIAEQLPNSWIDKWNAWRYMAMLGNARTHVRNLAGNTAFMPMIATKNVAAKIVEPIVAKASGGKIERSKTFVVPKKYRQFASKDVEVMRKELQGGGKHNPSDIIRDKKQIFDTKALEWLRVKVGDTLEAEDWLFLKHHYKVALSNYLAANKIDLDNMSESTLERARRVAIKEAQRNTYRDVSAFANGLSKFSKKNAATALLAEGLMPFKKTPVNVLKRGVEYSPAGLVKVLTTDLYKVTKGDITASEYIDRICCSLTGTGVLALGMLLKSLGLVSGASDDDKEKEFDELTGVQNYSLTIGGHSYTLDWLAPFSLPFFTGVEMQNIIEEGEEINFRNGAEALSNMAEPFFEMSMLQGLTGAVDTVKQSNSSEIAGNVLWNIGTNYVGQSVPTLFGQVARTVDGTQRRSYDDKNINMPSNVQYFVQGLMKKIPVLSKELEPYIDEWGRQNDTESLLIGAVQNMLSPGYYSDVNASPMEKELKRLYGEVGNEDGMKIFPTAAVKKFNLSDGVEKNLTAKEYTKMQTEQGQTAYKLLRGITESDMYRNADDHTKGKIVSNVYEVASANGKKAVAGDAWNPSTEWVGEVLTMVENGDYASAEKYLVDKGIKQVQDSLYKDTKDTYKEDFEFDASKYSEAEIGIIESVQTDWAGYHAALDMDREIKESDYRHIKVYEEKLADEMPIEEYAGIRAYAKKTAALYDLNDDNSDEGSESMSSKELERYLDSTDYSTAVKGALFEAIGNSNWYNKYYGKKNNGEPLKGRGGSSGSGGGSSKKSRMGITNRASGISRTTTRGTSGTKGTTGTRGTLGTKGSR